LPSPPNRKSFPRLPSRVSFPAWPKSRSSPAPPVRVSFPAPPKRSACGSAPLVSFRVMVSSPPRPNTSIRLVLATVDVPPRITTRPAVAEGLAGAIGADGDFVFQPTAEDPQRPRGRKECRGARRQDAIVERLEADRANRRSTSPRRASPLAILEQAMVQAF